MKAFDAAIIGYGNDFRAATVNAAELPRTTDVHMFPSLHPLLTPVHHLLVRVSKWQGPPRPRWPMSWHAGSRSSRHSK